ncbi:MAG: magnesium transporter [Pirellulales bacterium]
MTNTLYLPELREMLATGDRAGLEEFCTALHPARTAEFMEGLNATEAWQVLRHCDADRRVEIYHYFNPDKQVETIETLDRGEMAQLIGDLAPDERVDILKRVDPAVVEELLPLVPAEVRRDIQRLTSYPEGTAGSLMTSSFARLGEKLTARQAIDEIARQAAQLETVYYLYVVDEEDHLRGVVSARDLVNTMTRPDTAIADIMEGSVVAVNVTDDQEEVARTVARYDLLAIPVVDHEHHLVGIITHDDVIDVIKEEAVEDAQRMGAVAPLQQSYLDTPLYTLAWKRGLWLTVLFGAGLLTAFALNNYDEARRDWPWLAIFIPLIVSTGGNTGSQSVTLIIAALSAGHLSLADWWRVALRELLSGLLLGGFLALLGYFIALLLLQMESVGDPSIHHIGMSALVVPATLLLVVVCGTLLGAMLPLVFHRFGLDPALMSTPFVSGIIDIVGIIIYMSVALVILNV